MAAVRQLGVKMKKMQIPDVDPFKPYPMDRPKMGRAVIINNIHSESPESTVDVEALVETYEKVGFEVEVHNDCDAKKMGQIKREILKDETHEDSNCFVLTVICHGNNKGHLLDRNRIKGWVLEDFIGDLSLVESLAGRPKLLVIQSCRGVDWNDGRNVRVAALADDDDVEIPVVLPDKSDMFVAYATVPGYRAHRGDEGGSAYLQAFAAYLERHYMSQDLDAIYSMVNQYMASTEHGDSGMRQVSEKRSSLRFPLKFSEFHQTVSKTSVAKIQTKPALPPKLKRPQASPSQTTSPVLTLELLSTNETGLQYYGRETLTVLSTAEVLVWGIASEESAPAFHVFRPESTGFKKIKEIKRLCNHDMIHALSTNVNEQEQLVVSCEDCRSITLYDLKTLETKTVFSNPEFYNDVICHGERGEIYVGHEVKGDIQAFQLVWSGGQLLGPKKVIHSGMGQYFSMYYIPSPYKLLVFSDNSPPGVLHAVSVETGEKIWKASWDIAGMMACPHGMVFSPKHQALLVADGPNRRIIVLNPNDGSQLQIRPVGDAISVLVHLSLYKDKLILLYLDPENKDKVSYFAIR